MNPAAARRPLPEPHENEAAISLLAIVSDEIYLLATEMAGLGEDLSSACGSQMTADFIRRIQLFDPMVQRAVSQARLLQAIAALLAGGPDARNHLKSVIEAVPFLDCRRRVSLAAGHDGTKPAHVKFDDGSTDWF